MVRLIGLSVLLSATAAFAEQARWGLRWRAPEGCIEAAELSQLAEARLGRSVFGARAEMRIEGVMQASPAAPRWRAKFTLVDGSGSVMGSRELSGDDESCRALDAKLALVLALIIDPSVESTGPRAAIVQPAVPATEGVYVHLEVNDKRVRLFRFLGGSYGTVQTGQGTGTVFIASFNDECGAPCDTVIKRPGDRFFIGGEGLVMSEELSLNGHGGAVDLKVNPGSAYVRFGGWMMSAVGLAGIVCGALFLGLSSALSSSLGSSSIFSPAVSIGLLAGGGAFLAAGIPMIVFSSTRVELAPRTPQQPERVITASR